MRQPLLLILGGIKMLIEFEGKSPVLDKETFIADGVKVIGDVTIKRFGSLWFNTVARGDVNKITIGEYTNIQDNSVIHVAGANETIIGDFVTVGHNATIHGCTIEDNCLIGMSATILNGAVIGEGSIIAAGALVRENMIVPKGSLVVGVPAKIIRPTTDEERASIHAQAVKYKTHWTKRYNLLPNAGGEIYNGEKII